MNYILQVHGLEEEEWNLICIHMSSRTVGDFSGKNGKQLKLYSSFNCYSMAFCKYKQETSVLSFESVVKEEWF